MLFYTHVMDLEQAKTIQNEGLTLDTNQWYFIMYTIDTKNKKTYIRTRQQSDFHGFYNKTMIGQQWETRTLTEKTPSASSDQDFFVAYNSANGNTKGILGGSYGSEWRIDDLRISKTVCSEIAMEQQFNKLYLEYRELFFQMSTPTLFTLGMDV